MDAALLPVPDRARGERGHQRGRAHRGGGQSGERSVLHPEVYTGVLTPARSSRRGQKLGKIKDSVVDPKLFFPDPDPTLTLISDPDSNPDPACL